jgi:hypothetical protein
MPVTVEWHVLYARDVKAKARTCSLPLFSVTLHRQIRGACPKLQRCRLQLIHAGRLFNDGTQLSSWLGTLEERQQRPLMPKDHRVINDRMNFGRTVYIECIPDHQPSLVTPPVTGA